MNRFFGMMPRDEIKIEKHYKDSNSRSITIQAGENGWTVLYADSSSEYNDVTDSVDSNFKTAYDVALNSVGTLTEV